MKKTLLMVLCLALFAGSAKAEDGSALAKGRTQQDKGFQSRI